MFFKHIFDNYFVFVDMTTHKLARANPFCEICTTALLGYVDKVYLIVYNMYVLTVSVSLIEYLRIY